MEFHKVNKGRAMPWLFLLLILMPWVAGGEPSRAGSLEPPIARPLVREGSFARGLAAALGLGAMGDESAAEKRLGEAAIAPGNGWIADYPMTPDIVHEVRLSLTAAAKSGRIPLPQDKAQERFDSLCRSHGIAASHRGKSSPADSDAGVPPPLPDAAAIDEHYAKIGPPAITYFAPPAPYFHLYHRVPFHFRSNGADYPGFYIMKQFHRTIIADGRVAFVTNRFHVFRNHREFTIDALERFEGRSYAGIGAPPRGEFLDTGIRESSTRLFNGNQPLIRSVPAADDGVRESGAGAKE